MSIASLSLSNSDTFRAAMIRNGQARTQERIQHYKAIREELIQTEHGVTTSAEPDFAEPGMPHVDIVVK